MDFSGKKIVALGAGISGLAIAKLAKERGARVVLSDAKPADQIKCDLDALRALDIEIEVGKRQEESLLDGVDAVIVSPGIPIGIPFLLAAKNRGVLVMSEIEAAYRLSKVPIYAVTGTNGKTTTTTLLGELMKKKYRNVGVGGNIGTALSAEVIRVGDEGCVVAEISSYQLEGIIDFHPRIAVILNITPDHLARHGTLENYQKVKETIFARQVKTDYLVLNYDDLKVRDMERRAPGTVFYFSRQVRLKEGAFIEGGRLTICWKGRTYDICGVEEMKIKGGHNVENALAAVSAAFLAGVELSDMKEVLASFPGVEHRIEPVGAIRGVFYYNDSKATNPESTIKALETFPGHIVLIAGGHDKNTDLTEMMALVRAKADHLILIGDAAARFKAAAIASGMNPEKIHEAGYSMEEAVSLAYRLAEAHQVVLLSPACASFDMYDGFEERGKAFKALTRRLQ